ncbi:unnamed protein product [Rhodiola kirilowii]
METVDWNTYSALKSVRITAIVQPVRFRHVYVDFMIHHSIYILQTLSTLRHRSSSTHLSAKPNDRNQKD